MGPVKMPISSNHHRVPHHEQQTRIKALCERLLSSQHQRSSVSQHPSRPTTARNYVRSPSSSSSVDDDNHHHDNHAAFASSSSKHGEQHHHHDHDIPVPSSQAPSATTTPRDLTNIRGTTSTSTHGGGRVVDIRPHSAAATKASGEEVLSSMSREEVLAALPHMRLIGRYPPLVSVLNDDDRPFASASGPTTTSRRHEEYSPATFVARGGQVLTSLALQRHQCNINSPHRPQKKTPFSRDDDGDDSSGTTCDDDDDLIVYKQDTGENYRHDDVDTDDLTTKPISSAAAAVSFTGGRGDSGLITLWCADVIPIVKSTFVVTTTSENGGVSEGDNIVSPTTNVDDEEDDDDHMTTHLYSHRSTSTANISSHNVSKSRSSSLVVDRNVEPHLLHRSSGGGGSHNVLAGINRMGTTPTVRHTDVPSPQQTTTTPAGDERSDQEMDSVSIPSIFSAGSPLQPLPAAITTPPPTPSVQEQPLSHINPPPPPPPPTHQPDDHHQQSHGDEDSYNTSPHVPYTTPPLPASTPAFPTRRRAAIGAAINTVAFILYGFFFALESTYTSIVLSMVPILMSIVSLVSVRSDASIMKESAIYFFTSKLLASQRDSQIINPGGQASMPEETKERIKLLVREVSEQLIIHPHFELDESMILAVMRSWQERTPGLGYGAWAFAGSQNLCGIPLQCVRVPSVMFSAHNLSMANAVMSVITAVTSIYFFISALMNILNNLPPSPSDIVFYNKDGNRGSSEYPWVTLDNSDVLSMIHRCCQLVLPPLCIVLLALESRALGITASEGLDCLVSRNQGLLQRMLAALSEAREDDALGGGGGGARPARHNSNGVMERHGPDDDDDDEGGMGDGSDPNDDSSISSLESTHNIIIIATTTPTAAAMLREPREVTTPPPRDISPPLLAGRSPSPNIAITPHHENGEEEEDYVRNNNDMYWVEEGHVVVGRPSFYDMHVPEDADTTTAGLGLQSHIPVRDAHIHPDNHLISTAAKQRMIRMRELRRQRQTTRGAPTLTRHMGAVSASSTTSGLGGGAVRMSDDATVIPPPPIHPYDRVLHTIAFSGAVPLANRLDNNHHASVDVTATTTTANNGGAGGRGVVRGQPTVHRKHRPLSATRALRRIYGGGKGQYYY